eukprot:Phypoly_transcript_03508.p1 GENE.Phypoly_transcript_03508~~Phypoly_transcript_03508.p1  ORF type:complete len:676 (+),score=87.37 Phypoly_transcript_03508:125-2152(+)
MAHMGYGHRSLGVPSSGRAPEYLENLKNEFESMTHDLNMYKMQRDDFERKLNAQLTEFGSFQQTLYDLEKNHQRIKSQYEEEILRLRRQLENGTGNMNSNMAVTARELSSPTTFRSSSPVPLSASVAPTGVSGGSVPTSISQSRPHTGSGASSGLLQDKNVLAPPEKSRGTGSFPPNSGLGVGAGVNTGGAGLPSVPPAALLSAAASLPSSLASMTPSSNTPTNKRQRSDEMYPAGQGPAPSGPSERPPSSSSNPSFPSLPSSNPMLQDQIIAKSKVEKREEVGLPLPGFRDSKEPARTNTMDMLSSETPRGRQEEGAEGEGKDKGTDWIVGYNPGVPTNLNIDLLHNLNHSSVVCCVKFSSDGKYLATGCNKSAQIYDIESGRKVHTFIDDCVKDGDLYIRSVCFSPDGQHLATGAEDKTVKVWDITHKRIMHTFTGHELDIYSLDYSHDGRFIVSGSGDKKAKIWDLEKGRCAFTLGNEEVGPKDGVTSVAISPDGRLVAAGSLDRIVRLWDAQTGYFLERYEGHADSVYSVAFSPDGKSLASGSLDKTLKLWDLSGSRARSRCRSTFNGHKDFVLSVAFSPDGNWLISGHFTVLFPPPFSFLSHPLVIIFIYFKKLGSKDRSVQFWDPRNAVTHMMLQGHKNSVISVALSPAGGVFATGSGDYRARLWKYES